MYTQSTHNLFLLLVLLAPFDTSFIYHQKNLPTNDWEVIKIVPSYYNLLQRDPTIVLLASALDISLYGWNMNPDGVSCQCIIHLSFAVFTYFFIHDSCTSTKIVADEFESGVFEALIINFMASILEIVASGLKVESSYPDVIQSSYALWATLSCQLHFSTSVKICLEVSTSS